MSTDNSASTSPESSTGARNFKQSRLISLVLSPALRLWLRSQVQQVSQLEVEILGSDRQILAGNIPRISIFAEHAVYQGLHLSQIQLVGEGIRTNLSQVVRGQPLRLLEPIPVFGELRVQESDLNASLAAPLLSTALTELLSQLFPAISAIKQISWHKIVLEPKQLIINATLAADTDKPTLAVIRTGLRLASCHELQLTQPQIQTSTELPRVNIDSFQLDLGPEVAIEELTLSSGQLMCRGRINVVPAE